VTEREVPNAAASQPSHHYWLLLIALAALMVGYPYFENSRTGAFLGAVRTNRWALGAALVLALATVAASVRAFMGGVRGDWGVEATFAAFYAFTTVAIFIEVIRTRRVTSDTMYGAVCVYLLVGMTFGSLYDLIETIHPGSFQINVDTALPAEIRWRTLIFYSFMTLTTIGLGDVTPTTVQTQSLTSIEGVIGVL